MNSLKEKVKTGEQICAEMDKFYKTSVYHGAWTNETKGMTYEEFVKLKETKWIKVEDVKQKLQQLLEEFPVKREYCHEDIGHLSDISPHWRAYDVKEIDEWKQKFEELLKEAERK
jgi:DNA repair ATPase RecN